MRGFTNICAIKEPECTLPHTIMSYTCFSNKSFSNFSKRHTELFFCQIGRDESNLNSSFAFKTKKNQKKSHLHNFTFHVLILRINFLVFYKCIWNDFFIKWRDFKATLDTFLTKRKKIKIQTTLRRDNFNLFAFFTSNPYLILRTIHCLKRNRKWYIKKLSRRDKNAYLCLPSHLGS